MSDPAPAPSQMLEGDLEAAPLITVSISSSSQANPSDGRVGAGVGSPWYRSWLRGWLGFICLLLSVFSYLAPTLDKCGDANAIFGFVSAAFYAIFLFYLLIGVSEFVRRIDETQDLSCRGEIQLVFAIVSLIMKLMLGALTIYACVQLFVKSRCETRVWAMFVLAIDISTPITVCVYALIHKSLQVFAFRKSKKSGISPIDPFYSSTYMALTFFFLLLTIWSIVAVILQSNHTYYYYENSQWGPKIAYKMNWIMNILYIVLHGLTSIALVGMLFKRIHDFSSGANDNLLFTSLLKSTMEDILDYPEASIVVSVLTVLYFLAHVVFSILSFIFLIVNIHCGGLIILTIFNIITSTSVLLGSLLFVVCNWEALKPCFQRAGHALVQL